VRVAEQRRSDRGIPRGLSELCATTFACFTAAFSQSEFRSGLSFRVAQGTPRFCGAMNPGRLFFGSFLLAKQKKGTSRRATPGLTNDSPLSIKKSTFGANRFAHFAL
jgi:hypothetical protein